MTEIEENNEVADALQVDNVSKLTYLLCLVIIFRYGIGLVMFFSSIVLSPHRMDRQLLRRGQFIAAIVEKRVITRRVVCVISKSKLVVALLRIGTQRKASWKRSFVVDVISVK